MKKIIISLSLIASVCLLFTACGTPSENDGDAVSSSAELTAQSTTHRETSTTSPVSKNKAKGEKLKNAVSAQLGDGFTVSGAVENGSFEVKADEIDNEKLYENEMSDEYLQKAKQNAEKLVEAIEDSYPDELTLVDCATQTIGSSDNGIDSALYIITYLNTQNQELQIRCDSSGSIYYAVCDFTW